MTTVLILVGSRTFVLSEEISRHIFARCKGAFAQMIYLQGGDNAPFNKVSASRAGSRDYSVLRSMGIFARTF
jgi:hypothetical protein